MPEINVFATPDSICTVAGATAIIVAISNTLKFVFGWHGALPGFLVSQLVSLLIAFIINNNDIGFGDVVFSIINGCMLFASSIGSNEAAIEAFSRKPGGRGKLHGKSRPKFWSSWFRKE